jgi:hypothetical protein
VKREEQHAVYDISDEPTMRQLERTYCTEPQADKPEPLPTSAARADSCNDDALRALVASRTSGNGAAGWAGSDALEHKGGRRTKN